MASESPAIVAKLWNYYDMLQDSGVSYGDYVQQLTNLLFLKMDDEQTHPPYNKTSAIPPKYNCRVFSKKPVVTWRPTIGICWKIWQRRKD